MLDAPWYKDGLRFRCTRCGSCCKVSPGFVWIDDEEAQALATFLGLPLDEFLARFTRGVGDDRSLRDNRKGECIFYDDEQGCMVYDARPRQCQTWPFWQSNVATPRTWQKTCEFCPGSGTGDLISVEEITRRLQVVRL